MNRFLEHRTVLSMVVAAGVGVLGLQSHASGPRNLYLEIVELRDPVMFRMLIGGYVMLWFSTAFFSVSVLTSCLTIAHARRRIGGRYRPLPAYVPPEARPEPSLVLGEAHRGSLPGRAESPEWLELPQRGLYTGVMILGAVGTGKTSACMYPYVDQLLRWRPDDQQRKIGGLVLEVKGDFCSQVRTILARAGRERDYVEISLDGDVCYNPLHNDLDPYAVAFAIATLLNSLFGRSKEPFWQQAYTDLVKFVILLRRLTDGYTTLAEVYQYVLDNSCITRDIGRLKDLLQEPPPALVVPRAFYETKCIDAPWATWFEDDRDHIAHAYDGQLECWLAERDIPFTVRRAQGPGWAARRYQLHAVQRWFEHGWSKLDQRLRSSITEGVVVFLSLFDENPAVNRTFCPPREAYADSGAAGRLRPLPKLEELLESGSVLALNFPVALNPSLARALGVMLKLDFQRAVLQRIPRIAAQAERIWRDLIFVADEYHAFATVGETDPSGDERTFALSRQAKLMPIVATQSISSLRSALPGDESWRTLLQCFRTKIFLATSDDFTARTAAELCGRRDRLKAQYTLAESGHNTHVSWLTGRPTAARHTVNASKSYAPHFDYIFPPRVFTELQNGQAVALPYDGVNPLQPQFCYLKPHYLDVQTSYFDHLARGAV